MSEFEVGKLLEMLYYLEYDKIYIDFYICYCFIDKIKFNL